MSRLVVISNRGPLRPIGEGKGRRWVRSAGGLVTALDPVLQERGGVWLSGSESQIPEGEPKPTLTYDLASVKIPVPVEKRYYGGFSNAILWPVLHGLPSTIRLADGPWAEYVRANRAFAQAAIQASGPDDLIWVQDFHLTQVPRMLRRERPGGRIGWFCHVPWPGTDTFRILPWAGRVLEGLLGADLLGFHTERYATNFLNCVRGLTDHPVDRDGGIVRLAGRDVQVRVFPIGLDVEQVRSIALDPIIQRKAEALRRSMDNRRVILGVDRLDYTKGIPERLLAYERSLQRDPQLVGECVFVQVMVPSRTDVEAYVSLKNEVDRLVGSINGKYGVTGRVPIHYLFRNLDTETLYAHYRAAEIALVTPLRDGMNLVAQEYVLSRTAGDGVLILSELAGAAEYLQTALIVNPYDLNAVARTIQRALKMAPREAGERMASLKDAVGRLDVHRWADGFISALEGDRA